METTPLSLEESLRHPYKGRPSRMTFTVHHVHSWQPVGDTAFLHRLRDFSPNGRGYLAVFATPRIVVWDSRRWCDPYA